MSDLSEQKIVKFADVPFGQQFMYRGVLWERIESDYHDGETFTNVKCASSIGSAPNQFISLDTEVKIFIPAKKAYLKLSGFIQVIGTDYCVISGVLLMLNLRQVVDDVKVQIGDYVEITSRTMSNVEGKQIRLDISEGDFVDLQVGKNSGADKRDEQCDCGRAYCNYCFDK